MPAIQVAVAEQKLALSVGLSDRALRRLKNFEWNWLDTTYSPARPNNISLPVSGVNRAADSEAKCGAFVHIRSPVSLWSWELMCL